MTMFSKKPKQPSPEVIELLRAFNALVEQIQETLETSREMNDIFVGKLTEEIGATNELLRKFTHLQGEMITNMARYFRFEVDAIESTIKAEANVEPTPDDLRF